MIIGHDNCGKADKGQLRSELMGLVGNGVTVFISGGTGGFDRLCARMIFDLKKQFPHVRSYIVIPYLNYRIFNPSLFDASDYPECLESVPYRFRICHRNRYMVKISHYAVCYVHHDYGGAAQTYKYAQKQGLKIINIKNAAE